MPSTSKSQQRLFGMVHAYQKGKLKHAPAKVREIARHISEEDAKHFAKTRHDGLPERKDQEDEKAAAYMAGFLSKCAELGVPQRDAKALYKFAVPKVFTRILSSARSMVPRVATARNRVFGDQIITPFTRNNWVVSANNAKHAYRVTGPAQLADMAACGYVRPKAGKIRGGRLGEVHWARGGGSGKGYNNGIVLEALANGMDNRTGALGLDELLHVWEIRDGTKSDVLPRIMNDYFGRV